jgi:MFS transporter, DHA1 family, tetracycline resistance protein
MAFIYVTILLDVLGFGLLIPVMPKLVLEFTPDPAQGAVIFGLLLTVWSLMQLLFSPLLGALSDRSGRRPVLILSAIGLGLDYIILALAPTLLWLFVGRILSGILASSQPSAAAYVADVTPPERRAGAFGMIGAVWGIGFIAGPAAGGALALINLRFPFWAAAAMSLASAAYGFFLLPESLPREKRTPFSWRRANPVGSLKLLRSHRELFGLAKVNFLSFLAFQVLPSTTVIYTGARYGWDALAVGLTLTLVGFCNIGVQGILVKPFVKRYGERKTLYTGLIAGMAGFAIYGLAPNGLAFLLGVPVFAFIGLMQPALQSLMTRRVSPSEQGQLQGANNSIFGLTGVLGPVLFGSVLATFLSVTISLDVLGYGIVVPLSGAAFLLSAVLMLVAAGLAARVTRASAGEAVRGPTVVSPGPAPDPDGRIGPR